MKETSTGEKPREIQLTYTKGQNERKRNTVNIYEMTERKKANR
jgi:hypothetical protein